MNRRNSLEELKSERRSKMLKRFILILVVALLIFSGTSLMGCGKDVSPTPDISPTPNQTPTPPLEPLEDLSFIKGMNYASWTTGEFPFTTSWKAQTYFDSQAITEVAMKSDEKSFSGGYLELTVDLQGTSKNKRQGETFTDLRYPGIYQAFQSFEAPVNLAGKVLFAIVFCPAGSGGTKYAPNGLQLILKSVKIVDGKEVWSSFYGNWHNIWVERRDWTADKKLGDVLEGKWSIIAVDLSKKQPYGWVDKDFDPTKVVLVGFKVGLNDCYQGDFTGKILVDNFGWGMASVTGDKEIDSLPLDANILEDPVGNYRLFETRTLNEVLFTFEQTENPLDVLKRTGHNTISIVITQYLEKKDSVTINPELKKTNTDADVESLIQLAKSKGLQVFLKPHVDVLDDTWRGEISPVSIDEWFDSYTDFIVHYAQIAQRNGVDCLIIGTEFKTLQGTEYRDYWLKIIVEVRKVFSGFLTYSANWDDYRQVSFWDALDFVSIDAYFPLSDKRDPTLEELVKGWEKWTKQLEDFAKEVNKVIVFSELGYRSTDYAAREPWEYKEIRPFNEGLQKRCFEAALKVFGDKEWSGGFLIWNWSPKMDYGGRFNLDFTTQYKAAESIFIDFKGPIHNKTIKKQSMPETPSSTPTPTPAPVNILGPAAVGSPFGQVPFGEKAYSPNGKMYAREIEPRDHGHFGIFEVYTDKSLKEIKATQHPAGDYENNLKALAWSPDSKLLAVMYHHNGGGHISIIDIETGGEVKYISIQGWPHFMEFSPDGRQIIAEGKVIEIQ